MATLSDRNPVTIEYQTPGADGPKWPWLDGLVRWVNYRGHDSFVGCASLTFALAAYTFGILGYFLIGPMSFSAALVPCGLSVPFGLVALAERRTSKTFPLAALVSVWLYASGLWLFR